MSHAKTKGFFGVFWENKALESRKGAVRMSRGGGFEGIRKWRTVTEFEFLDVGFGNVPAEEADEVFFA